MKKLASHAKEVFTTSCLAFAILSAFNCNAEVTTVRETISPSHFGLDAIPIGQSVECSYKSPITGVTYKAYLKRTVVNSSTSAFVFEKVDNETNYLCVTSNPRKGTLIQLNTRSPQNSPGTDVLEIISRTNSTFRDETDALKNAAVVGGDLIATPGIINNQTQKGLAPGAISFALRSFQAAPTFTSIVISYNIDLTLPIAEQEETYLSFGKIHDFTAIVGNPFHGPQLTANTDGKIVYTTSNQAVAEVDNTTGEVTLVGEGTAVITASVEETDNFKEGRASYTLHVKPEAATYFFLTEVTDGSIVALCNNAGVSLVHPAEGTASATLPGIQTWASSVTPIAISDQSLFTLKTVIDNNIMLIGKDGNYLAVRDEAQPANLGNNVRSSSTSNLLLTNQSTANDNTVWVPTLSGDGDMTLKPYIDQTLALGWDAEASKFRLIPIEEKPTLKAFSDKESATSLPSVYDINEIECKEPMIFDLTGRKLNKTPEAGFYLLKSQDNCQVKFATN